MCDGAICNGAGPDAKLHDWKPAVEFYTNVTGNEVVLCNRCYCKMPLRELLVQVYDPGLSYYGSTHTYHCAPGKGCDANPRRMIGRHLREPW